MGPCLFASASGIGNLSGTAPPASRIIVNETRPVDEADAFPGGFFETSTSNQNSMTHFKMKIDFIVLK
jgi:hypothetical protein